MKKLIALLPVILMSTACAVPSPWYPPETAHHCVEGPPVPPTVRPPVQPGDSFEDVLCAYGQPHSASTSQWRTAHWARLRYDSYPISLRDRISSAGRPGYMAYDVYTAQKAVEDGHYRPTTYITLRNGEVVTVRMHNR